MKSTEERLSELKFICIMLNVSIVALWVTTIVHSLMFRRIVAVMEHLVEVAR